MPSGVFARVYEIVAQVPYGRVVTYGQIARAIGLKRGARVVGWAMRYCPEGLPWHRVVNAQGGISLNNAPETVPLQRALLESEGIHFDRTGHLDLSQYRWEGI